jgi:AcrR family transcriptional regulator
MPRPRTFDDDRALQAALDTFWAGGFASTSTEDLCEGTGLSRSSLYNAFQGKAQLYRRSLERYGEIKQAERACYLEREGTGRERLVALLTDTLAQQQSFDDRRTCLVVNAAVELGRSDEVVARLAQANLRAFRDLLTEIIAAGQADGSLRDDRPADDLAGLVHATLNGLQVAARVGDDDVICTKAVDTLMALL